MQTKRTSSRCRYDRIIESRNRLAAKLQDIYRAGLMWHYTSDFLTSWALRDIWNTPEYAKLSRYDRGYLHGLDKAYEDSQWLANIEWRVFNNGAWRTREETNSPGFLWSECISDMGAHFWIGTDCIYTIPDPYRRAIGMVKKPVSDAYPDALYYGLMETPPSRLRASECLAAITANDIAAIDVPTVGTGK